MAVTVLKKKVVIDYPQRNEKITSPIYTFRLSTPGPEDDLVDVSIDDAPPQPCRRSSGHWWYDWRDYGPGPHRLVATLKSHRGEILSESARQFVVALEPPR